MLPRSPIHGAAVALAVALAGASGHAAGAGSPPPGKDGGIGGVGDHLERAVAAAERRRRSIGGAETKRTGPRADVVLAMDADVTRAELAATGVGVLAHTPRYGRATVTVPDRAALERLATLPGVRMVRSDYGHRRRAGSVTSRAVEAMQVDGVTGLTGNGVTVGILSDSMSRTTKVVDVGTTTFDGETTPGTAEKSSHVVMEKSFPQQSNDLPARVEILQDDAGGSVVDEGTAMAELLHDIAPDADILFHTAAGGGIAGFADAIDTLCSSGADVVVDDVGFLAELIYQRDAISRAAEACVDRGVAYFSAAGNGSDRGFRAEFDDLLARDDDGRSSVFPPREDDFHNWTSGDPYLRVEVPENSRLTAVLQWNQPALSVPENSGNGPRIDLDLLSFAQPSTGAVETGLSSVVDQQAGNASAGQDPLEVVAISTGSRGETHYLAVDHWAGEQERIPQGDGTPLEFRLVFFESGGSSSIEHLDSPGGPDPAPSMYGHTLASGVQSVGAVPWFDAGPFLDDTNPLGDRDLINPEPFTARGGALERHFEPGGRFRRATQPPQPRIAASDGNDTTFFGQPWPSSLEPEAGEDDDVPNFFGTSAAAPNAAAVAALLLEDDASLAPGDIAAKLQASATDVDGADAAPGCDDRTGSGLVDAAGAVTASDRPPSADAGSDTSADAGDTVTLDGSASRDDDGVETSRWRQVAGPPVDLTNPKGAQTDFTAPGEGGSLIFELRVEDAACLSDADRVQVDVEGGGDGGGGATGWSLWALAGLLLARVPVRRRPA